MSLRIATFCLSLTGGTLSAAALPTLFIIGDSTVHNNTPAQQGWGDPLIKEFDPAKITVANRAMGGRSSRTFLTEGRWDAVVKDLKAGDFVLMQFGHNDGGGKINDAKCRASLKGNGDNSEDIVRVTDQKPETVHSYGWYLRKYITDAKAKGATAIVISPIPRNIWTNGKIGRSTNDYGGWAKQAADQEQALFIDFNNLLADRYEGIGQEKTAALFAGTDHTHTGPPGAEFNAKVMAEAIRGLKGNPLGKALLPASPLKPTQ